MPADRRSPSRFAIRERRALIALFVLVGVSRLPFMRPGVGRDPDAARTVNAAHAILRSGAYRWSRPPGHPVQEYVLSRLVPFGDWAINGSTVLMSCLGALCFALCLRASSVPAYRLLALGLACVPVVYINSTCALDYVWAMAFVLAGAYCALRTRPWLAGVCLGLAIGTRITSGAMLLPLALIMAAKSSAWSETWRHWLKLATATLSVGAACYVPVLASRGLHFFRYADPGADSGKAIVLRALLGVWGSVGCVALVCAAISCADSAHRARYRLARTPLTWLTCACLLAIGLYVVAYFQLPYEAGYLVPIVPFVIWLAGLWMTRRPAQLLGVLLVASAFIDVTASRLTLSGPVLTEQRERVAEARVISRIIRAAERLPERSIVVAGFHLPAIEAALIDVPDGARRFRYLLKDAAQCDALRREGSAVYYVDRATELYQARITGLQLRKHCAHPALIAP